MTALPKRKSAPQSNALEVLTPLPLFGLQVGDILQVMPKDKYSKGEVVMIASSGKRQRYVCAYLFHQDNRIALMLPQESCFQLLTLSADDVTIVGSVVNCQKLRFGLFA